MTQSFIIAANNNPNAFKLVAYETAAPNTAVDTISVPLPHNSSQTATFLNLNEVAHIVRLYEWTGSAYGAMLFEEVVQPLQKTIETPPDIELVVGVDLTSGATQWDGVIDYPDYSGYLLGVDFRVEQRGVGVLKKTSEILDFSSFGFELQNGAIFNDGDTFFIQFLPKIIVNPANFSSNSSGFKDVVELANSTTLDSSYLNKLIDINHTADAVAPTFILPAIANWIDMSSIGFAMNRGTAINAIIKLATGETIWFNGVQTNDIVIGINEDLKITKKNSKLYVENSTVNYNDVGKVENGVLPNAKSIIGEGQLLQRNEYVRLWRMVQQLTSGSGVISDSTWATAVPNNQFMYSYGDGTNTFRVPNYRGVSVRFIDGGRGLDGVRVAASKQNIIGSYEVDGLKTFNVGIPKVGYAGIGGNGLKFVGNANDPDAGNQNITIQGQVETTIKNVGLLPLIKI